ncbi:MAG: penicillin acylase family protein, partial [Thermoanaerobaculia bacterium]
AWGFTNTYGDWVDLVQLEPDPNDPDGAYLTPDGPLPFSRHQEVLRAKDGTEERFEVLETVWGPVIDTDHLGRRRALRWIAHDPQAVSFELLRLEAAGDIDEAMEIANRIGAPPQNFVVADADGRIGWTVLGPIPRRFGHQGRVPSSWAAGDRGWDGYLEPAEYPRVLDPPSGRIWTANGRVASGEMMVRIGLGTYAQGGRASQIRDRLLALDQASEADMLAIQLDDEALFLARWRQLLLDVLTDEATFAAAPSGAGWWGWGGGWGPSTRWASAWCAATVSSWPSSSSRRSPPPARRLTRASTSSACRCTKGRSGSW